MTQFRITVACPEAKIDDANDLAMVTASGPADARTYGEAQWRDTKGNLYTAASFVTGREWASAAQSTIERPEWDGDGGYTVNMAGAERAQKAILFWTPQMGGAVPSARPDKLVAVAGLEGPDALKAMGLQRVELEV